MKLVMREVIPDDLPSIKALQIKDVVAWVEAHGWRRLEHPNYKAFVYEEPPTGYDPPIRVFIPRHTEFIDAYQRLAEVVQALANYHRRPVSAILSDIETKQSRSRLTAPPLNGASASSSSKPKARRAKPQKSTSQRSNQ